jgi:hypothetical protein
MPFKVTTPRGKRIDGLEALMSQLKGLEVTSRRDNNRRLAVGYTAFYAIYVHERMDVYHAPPTRAKFLEEPMRRLFPHMAKIVRQNMRQTRTAGGKFGRTGRMVDGLLAAGHYLLAASLELVPIDTGFLRKSSFVRLDRSNS